MGRPYYRYQHNDRACCGRCSWGIVYGSILYTSAGGNAEQTKKAMGIITNVVIGIIAYGLMYVGLNFLVPGGVFG